MALWKCKSDTKVEIEAAFANRLLVRLVEHVEKSSGPGTDELLREARECMSTNPVEALARRMRLYRTGNWIGLVLAVVAAVELLYFVALLNKLGTIVGVK